MRNALLILAGLLVGYAAVAWWGDRRARRAGYPLGWDDAR